jgi:hypothetical protein
MSSTGVYDNGVKQQVQSSDAAVKVRLHQGAGGTYVWVVNPTRTVRTVKVSLPTTFKGASDVWLESNHPAISLPARGELLDTTGS